MAVRVYNEAIYRETGIENIACIIEQPTFESFKALCANDQVRLLLVTGGPGVVKAAMQTGKRAICAGPGNPPVLVDGSACMKRAAESVIKGASYDNNLLCIGEKEVFVVLDPSTQVHGCHGTERCLTASTRARSRPDQGGVHLPEGHGAGCGQPVVNRICRQGSPCWRKYAAHLGSGTQLLFAETDAIIRS
jgi:aldehyde dehydrogenase